MEQELAEGSVVDAKGWESETGMGSRRTRHRSETCVLRGRSCSPLVRIMVGQSGSQSLALIPRVSVEGRSESMHGVLLSSHYHSIPPPPRPNFPPSTHRNSVPTRHACGAEAGLLTIGGR